MYLNCSETIFCRCSNTRAKYRKYLQTLKVSFYFSLFQAVCLLAREERLTSRPSLNGLGFNHQSINQFSSVQQRIHSATSERVFSRAGLSMSPRRSRLQEHTLEMLTFLQCNLRLVPVPKPVAESVAISLRK